MQLHRESGSLSEVGFQFYTSIHCMLVYTVYINVSNFTYKNSQNQQFIHKFHHHTFIWPAGILMVDVPTGGFGGSSLARVRYGVRVQ